MSLTLRFPGRITHWLLTALLGGGLLAGAPSYADDVQGADDSLPNMLGVGVIHLPRWQGARVHRDQLAPYIEVELDDRLTLSTDDGVTLDLIHAERLHGGLFGNYQWGRSREDLGSRLGGIVNSLSPRLNAGGYVEYDLNKAQNLGVTLSHDTQGAGVYLNMYAVTGLPPLGSYQHSLQLQLQSMNGPAMRRFFGLTPAQATQLGVNAWRPGAGAQQMALEYDAMIPLGDSLAAVFSLNFARLLGDAADSPLVRYYGSPYQFTGSLALVYRF
ncbi:Outer membrane scaffolding protein for murein synthesis, MipA/OmpV family [Dyella sp. OK004]|nr:Outer membrane scaffolding protein for murein synthesis, MipA/OmpV family [Dyella sp. OK004]